MPLQATSGAASYDAFGGGVPVVPKYIEDYFSTYLVTGDGTAPAVNNGIDLSTKGGLVWIKKRSAAGSHSLFDTARGANLRLISNDTAAQDSVNLSFTTTGFSNYTLDSGVTYASWTLAKAPKFFDVVTYTGTGSAVTVNHNLGSTPGCIIIKATSNTGNWHVWHRSVVDGSGYGYLVLNSTAATAGGKIINSTSSTNFVVASGLSDVGYTYVCYVFAHNAGGFGLTGTDNVISCGSYVESASEQNITLGYEPQWIMLKRSSGASGWYMHDTMRGMDYTDLKYLEANSSAAEGSFGGAYIKPTATGFISVPGFFGDGSTVIYIAIRRGPMKVPTSGTSVFAPVLNTGTGANTNISSGSFAPDMLWNKNRDHAYGTEVWDKLRGVTKVGLTTSSTAAEGTSPAGYDLVSFNNTGVTEGANSGSVMNISTWLYVNYMFGRAPSFFDEVCYTGTGSAQTLNHNLGVPPELVIRKKRNAADGWEVAANITASGYDELYLNQTASRTAVSFPSSGVLNSQPTSTTITATASANTFVNYLFATCAGVSKCGTFTGTGTTQQVDCGFTGGARFVLIKKTSGTGSWYVWDSARGIVSGNDPYLLLNSTAAEVTSTDYIDTYSAGFEISSTAPSEINENGGSFIFLAIS